ncbi:MAG: sigma-54-dependent Fis family transcriptional regulator [Muribaculaceae bacterium]|nr:sigma-54-dependent Fis family transcriptional regulator [Muribaculaceae bacterium]
MISSELQQIKQRFSIIGNSQALLNAIDRAKIVAPYDQSVLVIGESGVGKEVLPKIIHNYSPRKHNKYIAVNCGAIPEGTIDSELFGHEKGSFTGAISARKGYFEEADGGTIFLDEVAELPLTTQARLLRVLENGEFIKVGSSEVQKTNIRVVAATNVDMLKAVGEGKFREDLYYRLSTVTINVPPLRDRGNDILLLARKFAADFADKYRTPGIEFSEDAQRLLLRYNWPGNVRQLKNVIEQVALFHAGSEIVPDMLISQLPERGVTSSSIAITPASSAAFDYSREREILFKMIFRMQNQIDEMQSKIETLQNSSLSARVHSAELVPDVSVNDTQVIQPSPLVRIQDIDNTLSVSEVKPRSSEVPRMMSLEDTERETIKQALLRNGGKRKKAAQDLQISERTLYRKIKEYDLEQL